MVHRSDLLRAKAIMDELPSIMPNDMVGKELSSVRDSINQKSYSTIGALYYLIQDMFVDSLHGLLAQLRGAIFNAVYRSTPEEFEERVRLGLKYLCKFETWDGISWEPPPECNCSSLLATETPLDEPNVAAQVPTQPEGSKAGHDEIGGSNGSSAPGDAIINV